MEGANDKTERILESKKAVTDVIENNTQLPEAEKKVVGCFAKRAGTKNTVCLNRRTKSGF